MTLRTVPLSLLALALAGCPTTGKVGKGAEGPKVVSGGAGQGSGTGGTAVVDTGPKISSRAMLLFEDALKSYALMKKARTFDYVSLERKFQLAAEADENFGEADYNLGVLAERQGKPEEALRHYREALRKKPTLKEAAENIGVIAQNAGNEAEAIRTFENILQNYPDDGASRARLADIYARKGECDKAIDLSKQALFREPRTLPAYKVLMRCAHEQKQYSMAKLVALRAMKLDENDPEIFHTLGLISLAEKEPAKARMQFKTAVEKRADYLPAHLMLVRIALEQQDWPGAEESIRQVLRANGKNPEAHLDLGVAHKGMGHLDKAMEEYEVAKKLNPNLPAIYLNIGQILALKGLPEKAIENYRQYIALSGENETLAQDLIKESDGVIQKREEDKKAAEEALKMEAEMKKQEEAAKAEEKKKADEELKRQQAEAKGGAAKDALKGADTPEDKAAADEDKKKCLAKAKGKKDKEACEKAAPPAVAPKEEPKKIEPVKGTPPPAKAPEKKSGEPSDEPSDAL
ncbi:MAG: adventurous gliding motility TPR repeat lipoprotein GltE [Myxococcaceae bacterium]